MTVSIDFHVNETVVASLIGMADWVEEATDSAVDQASALLLNRIKANASGRPGPNVQTGDYRRSWTRRRVPGGFSVGTNRPQGRRLEYGFVGADSLGRVYNQPPYPHVGPAVDVIEPAYIRAMEEVAAAVARGERAGLRFSFSGVIA